MTDSASAKKSHLRSVPEADKIDDGSVLKLCTIRLIRQEQILLELDITGLGVAGTESGMTTACMFLFEATRSPAQVRVLTDITGHRCKITKRDDAVDNIAIDDLVMIEGQFGAKIFGQTLRTVGFADNHPIFRVD